MASTQPIWAVGGGGFAGGGGFGATGQGPGGEPIETLLVGQTRVALGRQLGEGGFAFVYACTDAMDPSLRYVLKKILIQDEQARLSAEKEIRLLRLLQPCPQVVRCVDAALRPGSTHNCQLEALILMEHCAGGSLLDLVRARATMGGGGNKPVRFPREEILRVAEDVGRAVAALHHQSPHPIAHRDLKLENVLRQEDSGSYRLIDFGSCVEGGPVPLTNARERAEEEERVAKYTTQMYRAPEMVDLYMRRQLDEKVDIWALGCILFAVAHLVHPFQDAGNLGIINGKIRKVEVPPELEDVQALIDRMLLPDPHARLTIDEVLEHVHCLQAHKPLPPRTRFTQEEELQRQREEARRSYSTAPPPSQQGSLDGGRPRTGSAAAAATAAEAKRLDPTSAAARRLAARGGVVGAGGGGPVVPNAAVVASAVVSVAAVAPPPKPPTPRAGVGAEMGASGAGADALFFSTAEDGDTAAAGADGGLTAQFGSMTVVDPFTSAPPRKPSFDDADTTAAPVKPPAATDGWASFDATSPTTASTTTVAAATTTAFDPFPTSPGGQRRPQQPSPVTVPRTSGNGLLGDLMAPAPTTPGGMGASSQGGGHMRGDPMFMATMLAGTPRSGATAAVVPPPKPPKPAKGLSPSPPTFPPITSGGGEPDPFRSLLDPTAGAAATARPGVVASVVPPPKPPPMVGGGGGMAMSMPPVRASPPPPMPGSPYGMYAPQQPQQQPLGVSGSGYYSAASVGYASSPLNSSAGTAFGFDHHHHQPPQQQQHRATPPSPMMQHHPPQQFQQQRSLGGLSPSPYGVGFGSGGSMDGGALRPTSYPPTTTTSVSGGFNSPISSSLHPAAPPTTSGSGFGGFAGPVSPLTASGGHFLPPPASSPQPLAQQHYRQRSLSRSHSSFYEEADPYYAQTMPQQQGGQGHEPPQAPAQALDPYGFPTPPRPDKPGGGKPPGASPKPQQWSGSPF